MKKKEIVELFTSEMNPHFESWGFKFTKSRLLARQKHGEISKAIFFDANYFLGKAAFQPKFWIRNGDIMKVRAKVNSKYENKNFVTIFMDLRFLSRYYDRKDLDFLSESLNDFDVGSYVYDKTIDFYKKNFVKFMEEVGLYFFDSFNDLDDFDRWFNSDIFNGRYEDRGGGYFIDKDADPIYSYVSAFVTSNPETDKVFEYWMSYDVSQGTKNELRMVRAYLEGDYQNQKLNLN